MEHNPREPRGIPVCIAKIANSPKNTELLKNFNQPNDLGKFREVLFTLVFLIYPWD